MFVEMRMGDDSESNNGEIAMDYICISWGDAGGTGWRIRSILQRATW